jgi:hypothetical protein
MPRASASEYAEENGSLSKHGILLSEWKIISSYLVNVDIGVAGELFTPSVSNVLISTESGTSYFFFESLFLFESSGSKLI